MTTTLSGFGNQFATEAVAGALPQGRNSPQRVAHGLYAELLSGTAFTAPRADNRRTWMYRRQPSVVMTSRPCCGTSSISPSALTSARCCIERLAR